MLFRSILDDRVAERIRDRRDTAKANGWTYVIGSPANPASETPWDKSNRNRLSAALHKEMAAELSIPVMTADYRAHGWRTTLNMVYHYLPDHIRAAWFGHSVDVNHANYSDASVDLSSMVTAATDRTSRHLRAVGE